ncbi:MAG: LacI family DNA-binding transcriptional regulator [Phycisphaeraceae bacterium]|nr:LacI family DNA-binding transcriptional regulator [Phycisphaeraceae bacterium]
MAIPPITARDVGRMAGVHPSTVSRVLNRAFDHHRYAPDTVQRIHDAATKLGYQPSAVARAMRTGKSMTLGLVVSDIANPFFGELTSHIERHVLARGYRLMICNTWENPDLQADFLADLIARGVDGLLVTPAGAEGLDKARDAGLPVVTIDRQTSHAKLPHVGLDNIQAGRLLGQQLRHHGCQRIGIMMVIAGHDAMLSNRIKGLRDIFDDDDIVWIETMHPTGSHHEASQRVLARLSDMSQPRPDAVVGLTNHSTLGAYQAIRSLGLSIPDDIGLAGVDDFAAAALLSPPVSVVAQPLEQIAIAAADLLLQSLHDSDPSPQPELLPGTWVERSSL